MIQQLTLQYMDVATARSVKTKYCSYNIFAKLRQQCLEIQVNYKIHILDKLIMLQVCLSTCLFMLTDTNTLFKPEEAVSLSTTLIIQQYLEVQSAHERK